MIIIIFSGLVAVIVVYLVVCALQMRDGLFVRPHPIIWRVIMGLGILYLLLLVFLLFQTVEDARNYLHYLDPSLGGPLPERSYAEDCRIYTPEHPSLFKNIVDCFYDEFVIAHFLGWFGKALLLRDYWLCWTLGVLFEIWEISLEHLLPNFAECWWDHIIVDTLLCNYLGFWLGLKVVDYFTMKPYHWIARVGKVDEYHWEILSNWKRLLAAVVMIFTFSIIELNAFFLKFVLWIPPPHPINVTRIFLWWGIGCPGMREYYQWVTDSNCKKFGTSSWLCVAVMVLEVLIWAKFGRGMFTKPAPAYIFWGWIIAAVLFVSWAIWYFTIHKPSQKTKKN